ncbi:MAG: chromosome segregation protein SMC [bacterium]
MYLSKLEIFGFKSFAAKTILNFTKGITGIVGPNGCGKTNIVDALRWCLGEQRTSTLRSDKMENVIFNGTRNKKPMGMSEVSLTLENDQGVLPTEYTEVTITRRIFRSGESEYLLNKNICRLKDITNLFMDTGMGTNAYSVIELKMIEIILSNKAEERRHMFEEAAGVNKYKLRRKLSLKKLDEVKGDLTRVNDIVSEVEKTVRSLERQAKKADKYNQIQSVLKEKEIDLAEREFSQFTLEIERLTTHFNEYHVKKEDIDKNIRSIENELILFRSKIDDVESRLREKRVELNVQTELIHEYQKSISVAEEKSNSLNANIDRFTDELGDLYNQKERSEKAIEENSTKQVEFENEIKNLETETESFAEVLLKKQIEVEEKKKELKKFSDDHVEIIKEITTKENERNNRESEFERINKTIEKLNNRVQKLTTDIAKSVGFLEELENEKGSIQNKLNESESRYIAERKKKENLEKVLEGLKEKELDGKTVLANIKNKIEFLQTLVANFEGISSGSRSLLENKNWSAKGSTLFSDIGSAGEQYRIALEAALKNVLNNLVIDDVSDLQAAVEYLKKNELGKASFYLLKTDGDTGNSFIHKLNSFFENRRMKKLEKEKDFINWAYNLVEAEDKWRPYFKKYLSNSVVVENIESALRLGKKYPGFTFTTLEGDLLHNSGLIEAGSLPALDQTLFGRKQLLENLLNEIPQAEAYLKRLRKEIDDTDQKINEIDLNIISEEGKLYLNEINNIEKQISQLEFEQKKASEEIDRSNEEIQEIAGESNKLDTIINSLKSELTGLNNQKNLHEDKLKISEHNLKDLEDDYNNLVTDQNQKNLKLERQRGQLQNTIETIARAKNAIIRIDDTVKRRNQDISLSKNELSQIQSKIDTDSVKLTDATSEKDIIQQEEKEVQSELSIIKHDASDLESRLNKLRNERQEVSDNIHFVDLEKNKINLKLENITEHIKEEYSVALEFKQFEDLDNFHFDERNSEVHDLKAQLKNLGPINLLAYSEYEEEKERMDFLFKQRDDLVESEKDLIKTIEEINETAQQLFTSTFEQIRTNFKKIFQTLFDPGDEADLSLEEGVDPLEAKIEIMAKPKGKRPTSIELLSGGEKTLTATALLFAIYLVKPSPFCILDEVDAPLDDANVDRFTRLIKEFSANTQFIIVTHNKRTMESAETMYGVTMQEEGISKLASVKFNELLAVN